MSKKVPLKDRFWCKADVRGADECWNWTASKHNQGYGVIKVDGAYKLAHRMAFLLTYGHLDDDLYVCHQCDNRLCVNPSHLRLGTHLDNIKDMLNKGRGAKGEGAGSSKLTECDVNEILSSEDRNGVLARRFGVSPATICDIQKGRTWCHLWLDKKAPKTEIKWHS